MFNCEHIRECIRFITNIFYDFQIHLLKEIKGDQTPMIDISIFK